MTDTNAKVLEALFRDLLDALGPLRGYPQGADLIRRVEAAIASAESTPAAAPESAQAVIEAARQWWCEREIMNWDDADLARAVIRLEGDWPGCPECDHQCGEPCTPATVAEQLAAVDARVAQLVHEGKLHAPEGYKPPEGWQPMKMPKSRAHPSPARVAVALTEEQRIAVRDSLNRFPGYSERQLMVATERAVWAAHGLTAPEDGVERHNVRANLTKGAADES